MARKLITVRSGEKILCGICGREAEVYLKDGDVFIDAPDECDHLRSLEYVFEDGCIELLIPYEEV